MIKIEFPAHRTDIAKAIGEALTQIGDTGTLHMLPETAGASSTACDDQFAPDTELADLEALEQVVVHAEADVDTDTTAIGTRPGSTFEQSDAGNLPQVDTKGVVFDAAMCGVSAKPFYTSGKTSGQWKKRKGVDQAAYDEWYAGALQPTAAQTAVNDAPVNTAGAFNGNGAAEQAAPSAPTTCGEFMGWVASKQAAELMTQEDVGAAYLLDGIGITDLFPPSDEATIAERVASLYQTLAAKAGA